MTFGQNLQENRKRLKLSQEALANQLYVTRQSVSQWENDRTMPSVDLLLKLSEIFDTSVDALLGKPETESIPQPAAQADILRDRRKIRDAMRYYLATTTVVLFSLAVLTLGIAAVLSLFNGNIYSPELTARRSDMINVYPINVYLYLFYAAACAAAGTVTLVLRIIASRKAVRFGSGHSSRLRFFYDHMEIMEDGAEPLSLFYPNIKRITETDSYFVFTMQNRARLCIEKSAVEGSAEELGKLLKTSKRYVSRSLYTVPAHAGTVKRCLLRCFRDFLFTATFALPSLTSLIFALLCFILTGHQAARVLIWLLPFLAAAAETALGIVFTLRHIKAKRMIIAGGVMLLLLVPFNLVYHVNPLYRWQDDRITAEDFQDYMEAHGLIVDNTIKGRQETFITSCLTAHPANNAYEIRFMEFDRHSGDYGLFSAHKTCGGLFSEIYSMPRRNTVYTSYDLGFKKFFTENTNTHYSYVSLNEYSIICFTVDPEKQGAVQEVLHDWELQRPY